MFSRAEETFEPRAQPFGIARFAFPDDQHMPAGRFECRDARRIALFVPRQLRQPIAFIGTRRAAVAAGRIIVAVPETPMHEDRLTGGVENQVRFARQVFPVKPVAVSKTMREPAHGEFRLHAFAFDAAHVFRAPVRCQPVHFSDVITPASRINSH